MAEKTGVKESLPDLDDLLQCPVCYEIPSGHIFQCDQGHHVCGQCKARLHECPVCRALFFGTRNYAMEELIANVKRLQAFKLGGKVTVGSSSVESNTSATEVTTAEPEINVSESDDNLEVSSQSTIRPPQACKGLFRCLCCKNGGERLPSARLLNHLRYFHSPELIEGKSENGEYLQAWQFSTAPGRIVTAVRVSDMGVFFLVIEINNDALYAWLSMAAAPWVAHEFCYTVTISGRDREAIFSDCVWSVRSCEGSLKKRGHCLAVNGIDARVLTAASAISGKLSVRRAPADQLTNQTQPRAVLRVASRGNAPRPPSNRSDLEPFLLDLQNDVERLSRAFATLGREATALVRNEAEIRSRIENAPRLPPTNPPERNPVPQPEEVEEPAEPAQMSRNARRRMRQRLRAAMNANQPEPTPASTAQQNGHVSDQIPVHRVGYIIAQPMVSPPPVPPPAVSGPSNGQNAPQRNKKKRRQRR